MAYHVSVLAEHRLGILRLIGDAGAGDIIAALARLVGDPRWEPSFDAVWDCRSVEVLGLEPDDLQDIAGLARTVNARRGSGRRAIIVRNDLESDLAHLVNRMAKGPEREVRSFRLAPEAAAWLGVPAEVLEWGDEG